MKTRILMIDDERQFTSAMKRKLEAEGYFDVAQCNDPTLAAEAAEEFAPDLVLLDVMMPELNGFDVAQRLQNHEQFKEVPVIFLSALVRPDAPAPRFPISLSGDCTFLSKDTPLPRLIEAIEKSTDLAAV
jgi:CheY-like chemotaxis protein